MKRKLTFVGIVAGIHFLLFWTVLGILYFSDSQRLGFFTILQNPAVLDFLFSLLGVLSFPFSLLHSPAQSPFWVGCTMIALSLLNSGTWGILLGALYYAAKRLFQRPAA
jgi:membrane-bound ClpP family serine protease